MKMPSRKKPSHSPHGPHLPHHPRYEPASTAAILLTGGDEESEEDLLELCKEAEINCIVRQSVEGALTEYLAKGKGA